MKVLFTVLGLCVSGCHSEPERRGPDQAARDAVTRCAEAGGYIIEYTYDEPTDNLVVKCGQDEDGPEIGDSYE